MTTNFNLDYMAYRCACDYWEKRVRDDIDKRYAIQEGKKFYARLLQLAPTQGGYSIFK